MAQKVSIQIEDQKRLSSKLKLLQFARGKLLLHAIQITNLFSTDPGGFFPLISLA